MNDKRPYRIIISGGGTGGHIYPALAVADELTSRFPGIQILFVGAEGKMEMTKVPEAGYMIEDLPISGFQRKFSFQNLLLPFKLINSLIKALAILNAFKPDATIGFGGYASGPMLLVAKWKKVPFIVQEQNSHAGITNKNLGKAARAVCVAYSGMEKYFPKEKIRLTGNPVRKDILSLEGKEYNAAEYFGLHKNKKTILVLGGSLGARTINNSVAGHLGSIVENGNQLIWQTGKLYFPEMQRKAANHGSAVHIHQFIDRMDLAYAAADIIISRAGALSVSELCLVGKPAILVPSPNVAEDHQTKNARALSAVGAAIIVKDSEAEEHLISRAINLLQNEEKQQSLSKAIKQLGKPHAAADIVSEVKKQLPLP